MAASGATQSDYFSGYNDLSVHEIMLKDRQRTQAYRKFFEENRNLIKDKIVMDVGAGTGILSLFAATAGAKKVLAVEASSIAKLCEEIVAENNLANIIEVINGTVETISLPPGIWHVDIIVSEWMGFYLLHESMLDSVIVARDRFLAPDGILVPSHASIIFAPVDMTDRFQDRAEEWSNIYGFDFSPVASMINMEEVSKPLIAVLKPCALCTDPQKFVDFDLKTVTVKEVQRLHKLFRFPMKQDTKVSGFAVWFNVEFHTGFSFPIKNGSSGVTGKEGLGSGEVNEQGDACSLEKSEPSLQADNTSDGGQGACSKLSPIVLRTGPHDPPTHWKQTVIFLPRTIMVEGGINLCCRVSMKQDSSNKRHYVISVTLIGEDDCDDDDDDSDEQECDFGDSEDADVSERHRVPCDCGSDWCRLAAAVAENYKLEQQSIFEEEEFEQQKAQMEAVQQMNEEVGEIRCDLDSDTSSLSIDDMAADG